MSKNKDKCPICKKAPTQTYRPFCSKGCKDKDLLKWLGDGYRVTGPPAEEELARNYNIEEE